MRISSNIYTSNKVNEYEFYYLLLNCWFWDCDICRHERGIWSDIFPRALPPNEALSFCQNWLNAEAQMTPLPSDNAQPCPCTLDQALLDIVRFQPDPDCNMFNRESWFSRTGNCLHRRDATHCIRMTELGWDN